MDKGAHFQKCDFQVHSPRDNSWTGKKYGYNPEQIESLTEEQINELQNDRIQFAKEYIALAKQKGLNAIAITDHHDVVFAKVIRNVANELNQQFVESGQSQECVTVFPGVELTLVNPNCQCLLIFDADFPDNHLDNVLNVLGITPSNELDKNTAQVVRITQEHIMDLPHLHKKLNELSFCKGKYLVLPNVNRGGDHTLLRQGANDHYKKMPCVGGYVDKAMPTESGWKNKLNGGDVNYGNKSIGVISTSDNRFEDGRELGLHYSWIKWSEPSAEAFRQACLAKESRLSQDDPELPQLVITKIDVTNSKFLGSFSIQFNQQYNSLIGGRGTGKSTVLEYLRWALCDQTIYSADVEDLSELDKRRKGLIDKTLTPFSGEVRVNFVVNGVNHIVKRSSLNNEILLKIDNSDFQKVSEDEVRRILPIQAYSQKQLSSVGITSNELKRFIQSPVLDELGDIDLQLVSNGENTKEVYFNVARKKGLEKELDQLKLEKSSLTTQAENLRQSLSGVSIEDQVIISRKQKYDLEANVVEGIRRELNTINSKVNDLELGLSTFPEPLPNLAFENADIISQLDAAKKAKIEQVKGIVDYLKEALKPDNSTDIRGYLSQWKNLKDDFDQQYEIAKSKTTSNQQQLSEIERIEDRLKSLEVSIAERNEQLRELGDPISALTALRLSYWDAHRKKSEILTAQASKLEGYSKGQIRVAIQKHLDTNQLKTELMKSLHGSRIQADRVQLIFDHILNVDDPLSEWNLILEELQKLAEVDFQRDGQSAMPETLKLIAIGLSDNNLRKIADVLTQENWVALATISIDFTPEFKYTTNSEMGDYIPFSEASAGQQATALLTILLNQPGAPLIIDQPEDDIDNRAIDEIIKNIWLAKKHRQILFTSHNANLVVNGDAELVICCDYRESGNQTRGSIKAEGAIDSRAVKDEITSVMEGGEKAFRLRKDKYGF